jgi:hypothetical protein
MFYVLWNGPTGLRTWTGPFDDRQTADAVAASHHTPGLVATVTTATYEDRP